jgi:hypothetical protein
MKEWRTVWDASSRLDLHGSKGIRVSLRADDPAAIQSVVVYFRSGSGWYRMPDLHPTGAWTVVNLLPGKALIEGKPVGWKTITGVRVSALPAGTPRRPASFDLELPAN